MESLKGEIAITMDVNSDYTVRMLEAKIQHRFTYLVLEICDTDLRKELASRKFTEADCVHAFEEIIQGFSILVHKGYIHRDVKPANTLVKNSHYKVADFGFACKADILGRKKLTDICGTPIYMAPQLLKNQPYTAKSDIWSLGLMLYEMIFGYAPWPCRSLDEYLNGICNKPLSFPYNAKIGENTKDFLKRALVVDEEKRMGWEDVFNHPLVKHKECGQDIKQIVIEPYVREILMNLQAYADKHCNYEWPYFSNKYSKTKVDFNVFQAFLREINPQITTHEISVLFDYLDNDKNGVLEWGKVEHFIYKVDYRSTEDVFSRKIDEIIAILRDIKADPVTLFDKIDLNHSGSLDFSEFSKFIFSIAPRYTKAEVLQLYKLFDSDKNGLISKTEFLEFITRRMPSKRLHTAQSIQRERAARNIQQLTAYIKWSGINATSILNMADTDHSKTLDYDEFADLLTNKLKFKMSTEEIEELFTVINKDHNEKITIAEIAAIL